MRIRSYRKRPRTDAEIASVNRFRPEFSAPLLTADEIAFGRAVHDYKITFNRPHPSWREVLDIIKTMSYRRVPGIVRFKIGLADFQHRTRRKFPTFSEVHQILIALGAKPPAKA